MLKKFQIEEEMTEETLNYCVTYVSEKDPMLQFEIRPLTRDLMKQVSDFISEIFTTLDPVNISLGITKEEFSLLSDQAVEIACNSNMGIVALEKFSQELASVLICVDKYDLKDINAIACENSESLRTKWNRWITGLKPFNEITNKYTQPSLQPLEKIYFKYAATNQKYAGHGLITRLIQFVMSEHPLTKAGKIFFGFCANLGSAIAFSRCGLRTITEMPYSDMEADGEKIFEGLERIVKEMGLKSPQAIRFLYLDRSESN